MPPPQSAWTIDTLKEMLEGQIKALDDKCVAANQLLAANAKSAADALVKQANEYERRLSDLNHEAARIAAANAVNISRDVYNSDHKADEDWKHRVETLVNNSVTQTEYRSYKESTSTALNLQAGKREGVGITGQTVLSALLGLSAVVGIALGAAALLAVRPPSTLTPAPQVVYVQPDAKLTNPAKP